ncbi:MAG: helix-turn-helix transcriptional regulator [Candidatus Pristimantibacillus sp.]
MKNEKIIEARKENDFTQEQLANLMNCKKSTISNWENGYSVPKLADALKLSEILGRETMVLFSELLVQDSHTIKKVIAKKEAS